MEISNKTLALILAVSIVVSLGGVLISLNKINELTGFATNVNGTTTLTLNETVSLKWALGSIDWVSGYVNATAADQNCTMNTSNYKSSGCVGFTANSDGLVLENDGNRNLTVTLQSNDTQAQFIGGGTDYGGPQFKWKISVNGSETLAQACASAAPTTFAEVNATNAVTICNPFNYVDAYDTIKVDLHVNIPVSAPAGAKTAILTAIGASWP
ncbi:TPA: hypothetical protein HA371_03310 [Candidatus Woesearchaeota archaeon]|nr:hypothetical protein [Candidatus Woesearchaeota archaeon]